MGSASSSAKGKKSLSSNSTTEVRNSTDTRRASPTVTTDHTTTVAMSHPPRRKLQHRTVSIINQEVEVALVTMHPELKNVKDKYGQRASEIKDINNRNKRDKDDMDEEYQKVYKLTRSINDIFHEHNDHKQRAFLGSYLAKLGFVEEVVKYYSKILQIEGIKAYTHEYVPDDDEDEFEYLLLMEIRMLLWNHADESEDFARKVATTSMFQHLVEDLKSQQTEHRQEMLSVSYESQESFAFNSTMGIINNCARNASSRSVFTVSMPDSTTVNMVDCLQPFISMENKYVKLVTLLALSHIMNEEENRTLTADKTILEFLLEMISKAADSNDRRHFGFSVHELVDGLANFAKNDSNKNLLMDMKALDILRGIIMKGSILEQTAVAKALWELAFLKRNKEIILKDKELYKLLQKLKKHDVEELKNAADGACFVIDQKDAPVAAKKEIPKSAKRDGHIMISYNWADQKVLIQIKEWLIKDGFNVWMDIENMEGSLLESMARGIENASLVLLCYSEKYKDSQNCRTEAEYTYKLKKETIPLRMQSRYEPDGWLGILIGSKLFYDFSGVKYPIESKYKELVRALNNQDTATIQEEPPSAVSKLQSAAVAMSILGSGKAESSVPAPQPQAPNIPSRPRPPTVNTTRWTKEDISRWLKDNRLESFSGLKTLSGEQIAFLYKMFYRAPESFYRCIQEKLGMKSLEELMRFSDAVEGLEYY